MYHDNAYEIMSNFAMLDSKGIIKKAWTWRDIVTELGVGAVIDASVATAIFAGAGAGVLPASFLPASAAYTASAGAGAALAAVGLGPIALAVLGGAAVSLGMWYIFRQADDNLTDLVDRLEDLDPSDEHKAMVDGWIKTLKHYEPLLTAPPSEKDPNEAAKATLQRHATAKEVLGYLNQMMLAWPNVKMSLKDWGFDPEQFEEALILTIKTIGNSIEQSKQYAQQETKKVVQQVQKKVQNGLTEIASDISGLYDKLTQLAGGKPPTFDNQSEKLAWSVSQKILGKDHGTLTQEDIARAAKPMRDLKTAMEKGVQMLSSAASKTAPPISKRALTLGDGRKVGPQVQRNQKTAPQSQKRTVFNDVNMARRFTAKYNKLLSDNYGEHRNQVRWDRDADATGQVTPMMKRDLQKAVRRVRDAGGWQGFARSLGKELKPEQNPTMLNSRPGKGSVKSIKPNTSRVVHALQILLNSINTDINAGAGVFRETGKYDWNTANALVGVISSNPRIMNLVSQNAKVNFDTIQDLQTMNSRPDLIKRLYTTLKSPAVQEIVEEMTRKHVPLSRRDIPRR